MHCCRRNQGSRSFRGYLNRQASAASLPVRDPKYNDPDNNMFRLIDLEPNGLACESVVVIKGAIPCIFGHLAMVSRITTFQSGR